MEKQFSKLTLSDAVVSPMNLRNNKRSSKSSRKGQRERKLLTTRLNCKKFHTFLDYVKINYVGDSVNEPLFDITWWSVYERTRDQIEKASCRQ